MLRSFSNVQKMNFSYPRYPRYPRVPNLVFNMFDIRPDLHTTVYNIITSSAIHSVYFISYVQYFVYM